MTTSPDPIRRAELTHREVRVAARWLRQQAEAAGLRQAEHLLDRRHRPRRDVDAQPRDTKGRWTR